MNEIPSIRRKISLDSYQGIGRDFLKINSSIADGFMRVADMRADIAIIKAQREKDSKPYLESTTWYVPIDDRKLMDQARTGSKSSDPEEAFYKLFKKSLRDKIDDCLGREKLYNAGGDFPVTLTSYMVLTMADMSLPFAGVAGSLNHGNGLATAAAVLACMGIFNAGVNMVNEMAAANRVLSNPDQPFIRHPLAEKLLPPVPVDRLVRGQLYLLMHGNKLIDRIAA